MSDASVSTAEGACLGTQKVDIRKGESDVVPGMVAVFSSKDSSNDELFLKVLVTEGKNTFSGRIYPDKTKVKWEKNQDEEGNGEMEDASKIKFLSKPLLEVEENEQISVAYSYDTSSNLEPTIKMLMRERLSTGVVRILWSDRLKPFQPEAGAFAFCSALGSSINQGKRQMEDLQKQCQGLLGWKDTAEKLNGEWQKDKDELLERFLILYKKTQEELRKALTEIDDLKKSANQEPASLIAAAARTTQGARTTAAGARGRNKAKAAPAFEYQFGRDVELYDTETVERLAEGRKGRPTGDVASGAAREQTGPPSVVALPARKNPLTGSIEVWDVDALLDEEDEENSQPLGIGATESSKRKASSQTDLDERDPKHPRSFDV